MPYISKVCEKTLIEKQRKFNICKGDQNEEAITATRYTSNH